MNETNVKSLSNDALLRRLSHLVSQSRRIESVLVVHIAEVDARRLYAREASPSMFKFCTDVLHLSEAETFLRIEVARTSRRHPAVLAMLEDGRLHLSGIATLAPELKKLGRNEGEELLRRAVHKSKREIKEMVAALAPKPDVPPSIRKAPESRKNAEQEAPEKDARPDTASEEPTTSGRSQPEPPKPSAPESRDPRAKVEPLAPARYIVKFTADTELRDKLQRLSALMPGVDLAAIVDAAVTEKLERLEAKRFGKTSKPRKNTDDADTSPGARGISAPVRRAVFERDGSRCTFLSEDGRRCPERDSLEFHHVEPYARGGDRSPANIRLMCKTHNLYMAEMDYGKKKMDEYRRSAERVREPTPAFELRPDVVDQARSVAM